MEILGPYDAMRPPGIQTEGLKELIKHLPMGCIMAEVGSCRGDAAEMFLEKAARIYCIDIWQDWNERGMRRTRSHEVEAAFDKFAARFPMRVIKIKADSAKAVEQIKDGSLDVVYIDGNHDYDFVAYDIKVYLPKVKSGGIIAGHDYYDAGNPTTCTGPRAAVDKILGGPDLRFVDASWLKRVS